MSRIAILFAGALAIIPLSGAQAQTINTQAISTACSGAATNCAAVVLAQIAALRAAGVIGLQLDVALGQIAATVQTVSVGSTPAARVLTANVMREVAVEVSDPAQATAIVQAAAQVEVAGPSIAIPAVPVPPAPVEASPT